MQYIKAGVIDENYGLREYNNIKAIRIRSREYVLLIMVDYAPALGKIEGDVTFLTESEEIKFEGIVGFYKHQRNEFSLLIVH